MQSRILIALMIMFLLPAACLGIGSPVGVVPSSTNPSIGDVPPDQPPAIIVQPPSIPPDQPPGTTGGGTSPSEGAPEPGSLVLALLGTSLTGWWLARRRGKTLPAWEHLGCQQAEDR
jgi:hypothetical protein